MHIAMCQNRNYVGSDSDTILSDQSEDFVAYRILTSVSSLYQLLDYSWHFSA